MFISAFTLVFISSLLLCLFDGISVVNIMHAHVRVYVKKKKKAVIADENATNLFACPTFKCSGVFS